MDGLDKTLRNIKASVEQSKIRCYRCGCDSLVPVCQSCADQAVTRTREIIGIPTGLYEPAWLLPPWASKYLNSERGLFIHGRVGVGKSATCTLLLMERVKAWFGSWDGSHQEPEPMAYRFISYPLFVMKLQDAYIRGETDKTAYRMIQEASKIPILVIDDLGAEKLTDFVRQATYTLINEREQWRKTTYITSNWSVKEIADQIDVRVASRIVGLCDVIEMKGSDRRVGNGAELHDIAQTGKMFSKEIV